MLVGGTLAGTAVLITTLRPPPSGWLAAVLAAPAPLCIVLAVTTMVVVSARTQRAVDQPTSLQALARIHRADDER